MTSFVIHTHTHTHTHTPPNLGKEMATHSSILSWRIPWTEEPGGLQSVKWQESDNLATKQQVYYFPGNKLMHPNEQHPQTHLTTTTI